MTWMQTATEESFTEKGSSAPVSQSSPNDATVPSVQPVHGTLPIDSIRTGRNIRASFGQSQLEELASSIALHGILEPLIVTAADEGSGEYLLVAGERRYLAAQIAGLETAPCQIYPALSDSQILEIMFSENLQRVDLNPIEEAEGLRRMLDLGMTQSDLGRRLGRSQEWVANRLRLLDVSSDVRDRVISQEMTPAHVLKALSYRNTLPDPVSDGFMDYLLKHLRKGDRTITVSDIEGIFKDYLSKAAGKEGSGMTVYFRYRLSDDAYGERCRGCPKNILDGYVCLDSGCLDEVMAKDSERRTANNRVPRKPESVMFVDRSASLPIGCCCGCSRMRSEGERVFCDDPSCYHDREQLYRERVSSVRDSLLDSISEDASAHVSEDPAGMTVRISHILDSVIGSDLGIAEGDTSDVILTRIFLGIVRRECSFTYGSMGEIRASYLRFCRDHGMKASSKVVDPDALLKDVADGMAATVPEAVS